MRKRGRSAVDVPSAGDQWEADICLMLKTSKPGSANTSEVASARGVNGRCHITAFIGFWDLGYDMKYGRLLPLE
jgi:hypothetical protein